ncbi:hypothetical protein [Paenibacillus sp. MBLB4367]|uniref:hypothetical protein n=1 Tax=Paenibacillus sp. MBLB4367 TaxID=3384767 RepID=UPI00390817A7
MPANKIRFIERDYFRKLMIDNSEWMTEDQIEKILDQAGTLWDDLTFKFYDNGKLEIFDNHTEQRISLHDLRGAAYDFYVKERIRYIRTNLQAKILQSA